MSAPLRFALVGHPVAHSVSPAMQMAALRAMGLPHLYEAIDCPARASFDRVLMLLRRGYFAGLNVTAPYKGPAFESAGVFDDDARRTGAANTLRMRGADVEASNTDLPAMIEQLQAAAPRLGVALIVGSGGVARAALEACQRLGVRLIGVTSRSWYDTEVLYESTVAQEFRDKRALTFPWPQAAATVERTRGSLELQLQWGEFAAMADVIIQATSAGLAEARPRAPGAGPASSGQAVAGIIPWDRVPAHAVAYEVIYGAPTPFALAAERRGLRVLDGAEMLARQGARSLSHWLGQPAPYEVMLAAARAQIGPTP